MKKATIHQNHWLLWLPIYVSIGVLSYFASPINVDIHFSVFVAILAIIILISRKYKIASVYAAGIMIGFIACIIRTHLVAAPILPYKVEDRWIRGKVEEIQHSSTGARLTLTKLRVSQFAAQHTPIKVKVTVKTKMEDIKTGDVISFRGTLMPPPAPAIPGGFDYQRFAYYQQIGGIGYASSRIKLEYSSQISSHFVEKLRQVIIARINHDMPQPSASIASGMLVGDTSYLKQAIYEQIKTAGIAHVIAISGMHMVVIVSIIFLSVRWLCNQSNYLALHINTKKLAAAISILGSLFYLFLAGNPISAQRAFLMSSMILLAIIIDRQNHPLHSLAAASTLLLLITPESLLNPSLQMSIAACFGLICTHRILKQWLPVKQHQSWSMTALYYGINISSSTLVAGIFTAPFIMYHFHQFSTYSTFANLICIPLTDFILMPLGLIGLLLMPFGLEYIAFYPMEYGINFMTWIATKISSLPSASIFLPSIAGYFMAMLSYGAIMIGMGQKRIRMAGAVMVASSILSFFFYQPPDIITSANGKLFAVRYQDNYYFSDKRSSRFIRKIWSESLGVQNIKSIKQGNVPGCTANYCEINQALITTMEVEDPSVCNHKLIINLSSNPIECSNTTVITSQQLSDEGTHMFWLKGDKPTFSSAIPTNHRRPWHESDAE